MIPQKRKGIIVKIEDYDAKAKQIIEERQNELSNRQQKLAHDLTSAQDALEKINTDKQKQLKSVEKNIMTLRLITLNYMPNVLLR